MLCPSYWKQGIMTEALRCMIDYARTSLGIDVLHADPFYENVASFKMLTDLGFVDRNASSGKGRKEVAQGKGNQAQADFFLEFSRSSAPIEGTGHGSPRDTPRKLCRWCLTPIGPSSEGVRCEGCIWAWYCSSECEMAHWKLAGDTGHQWECPGAY
jgi:hypothetical protein